jgi:hypothetical protein
MSLLYKDKKDVEYKVIIKEIGGKVELEFEADCGKFGTTENLDRYFLTPERLLQILQDRDDYTDDEL